jgi:hypothetical protein
VVVAYAGPKPADSDLPIIQDRVTEMIGKALPVEVSEQDRKTAEVHYTKNPVNGQFIYEKKEPPATVTSLTIVTIPEWTVSVTAVKDFVATTKEVVGVKVLRFNHREAKQELEVCFELSDVASQTSNSSSSAKAASTAPAAAPAAPKLKADTVADASNALFDAFFEALAKTRSDIQLSTTDIENIKRNASLKSSVVLTVLKNSAYAAGFGAHLK